MMRRRGFTILEVVISVAILAILALAIGAALIPLGSTTATLNVSLDLDRNGRRVMDGIRREVRQSGFDSATSTSKLTLPADGQTIATNRPVDGGALQTDLLTYEMRTGPNPVDWAGPVTIRAVPDGSYKNVQANSVHRYRLERVEGANVVVLARNVTFFEVQRPVGGVSVLLALELSRVDPEQPTAGPRPPVTHIFRDQVQLLNRGP